MYVYTLEQDTVRDADNYQLNVFDAYQGKGTAVKKKLR